MGTSKHPIAPPVNRNNALACTFLRNRLGITGKPCIHWLIGMQPHDIHERFEALRRAWIAQNPVDLRDDPAIEDAMTAWKACENQNPSDSGACFAYDKPKGGGNPNE